MYGCVSCSCILCGSVSLATSCMAVFPVAALSVVIVPGYDVYGCVFCGCNACRSVSLATTCMALFSVAALSVAVPPWLRRIWLCFL